MNCCSVRQRQLDAACGQISEHMQHHAFHVSDSRYMLLMARSGPQALQRRGQVLLWWPLLK